MRSLSGQREASRSWRCQLRQNGEEIISGFPKLLRPVIPELPPGVERMTEGGSWLKDHSLCVLQRIALAKQYEFPQEIDDHRIGDVVVVFHYLFVDRYNQERIASAPNSEEGHSTNDNY